MMIDLTPRGLCCLAHLAEERGDHARAAELWARALTLLEELTAVVT